ncbi:TPA: hypothetical protein HLT76_25125 [Escherichia coli]|uniref:hypothetical protein n=1 Tax=Shigella sonnei TaxID=624 RepID=UPI000BB64328|nr:hypothetical protein [Shigella sonnei]PBO13330.1 hypothetical protein CI709_07970 [Shigella sonnei]HAJ3976607.1 hypothetical protein [Escherichia coli]
MIEVENMPEVDTRSVEEKVQDFINAEMQKLEQQHLLARDNLNRAKANAKREYLDHCKRHLCGNAVQVMQQFEKLAREGWSVDLKSMQLLPGFCDLYLTPPDKVIKAGIRAAQREAVAAYKLRLEVERKNALDTIQKAAGDLFDQLTLQEAIEKQKRVRDALISKLVLGEKTAKASL